MKLGDAKTLVKNLLDAVNVSVVYYIDDYLSFNGLRSIMAFIEDESEEELQKHAEFIPERFIETRSIDPNITEEIQSWWHSLPNKTREKVLDECVPDRNVRAERQIQQLLEKRCIMCSPNKWDESYSTECLERIKKGERVLLLFDQKLGLSSTSEGEGRTGLSMAQSFCGNAGVMESTYCGIFSQSFEIEEEFEFRENHRKELLSWAFPLSKKRLNSDEDYTLFIEGLNNLLWVGYSDSLSEIAEKIIEETSNRIRDEFGKILPLEFKQIVIDSSSEEGSREIDTLLRLIHILFERELQGTLANTENCLQEFNKGVSSIKKIDSIVSKKLRKAFSRPRYDRNRVRGFFQDETFVPGSVINPLLMPLQNGDVFLVNETSFYVLLCQPCTISIRQGGKRGGNGLGYFVPLEESKAEESIEDGLTDMLNKDGDAREKAKVELMESIHDKLQKAAQGYSYKVKCLINDRYLCAAVNKYRTISLPLLDYCTFSEDGTVIINKECSPNLHENQIYLHENHKSYFSKMLDLNHLVEGIDEECKVVMKSRIEGWYYSFLTWLGIKSRFENNQYHFPIKRFGHIQDPLASDLFTQLSHYLSRTGLPNEFDIESF